METTEKIVEAYVRYVKGWFTLPNIKCKGQYEIDLLAIDPSKRRGICRYHIETGVSISGSFSRLTTRPYSSNALKKRIQQPRQRKTLGYFTERKFGAPPVLQKLEEYGLVQGNYGKIIVSWGWNDDVPLAAKQAGVELWDIRDILDEIAERSQSRRTYFTDDTMRTLQLLAKGAMRGRQRGSG
ncbi:MAG: hypothetical protein GF330_04540 [Candidatus Eisenbacteria bacterium]|nr:hypothetical protein [Candidatus Eisenbacteria bacterium]